MIVASEERKSRLGILGGTFDPIHTGHLELASKACSEYSLSRLLIMPSGLSYMKSGSVSPAAMRGEMVRLAILDAAQMPCAERFMYDDREIKRGGYSYTCDTVMELSQEYGDEWEFYYIVGGDTILSLRRWKNIKVTFDRCIVLVAGRGDDEEVLKEAERLRMEFGADIRFLESFDPVDISSTHIRKGLSDEELSRMLTPSVRDYIKDMGLYINYSREFIADIEEQVKKKLKKSRFRHTLGVAYTASCMAMRYGVDVDKAYLAGILHDNAKHLDDDQMLKAAREAGIAVTDFDRRNPFILHGPVGAARAKKKFGIRDADLLNAVANHTVGRCGMSLLEEIVFIADYIEYGRDRAVNLSQIRALAFEDTHRCMKKILTDTAEYIGNTGQELDERMLGVLDYYKDRY